MLRTAIDLKEAIENIGEKVPSIGTYPLMEYDWDVEHDKYYDINDYNEENIPDSYKKHKQFGEIAESLENIFTSVSSCYYIESDAVGEIDIAYKGVAYSGDLNVPEEVLRNLYEVASPAPFGDVAKLETRMDETVRNARDISNDYFEVSQDVIDYIATQWKTGLSPSNVIVKPYKINIYGEGGHFEAHKDTPDKDMVGTALVSLSKNGCGRLHINPPGEYKFEDLYNYNNTGNTWNQQPGSLIMFYTDCPHKVYSTDTSDIRATVAFKIYHNTEALNHSEDIKSGAVLEAINQFEEKISKKSGYGLLLGHDYTLHTESLKGSDKILVDVYKKLGRKFVLVPIVHRYQLEGWNETNEIHIESKVYPLTDSVIDAILTEDEIPPNDIGTNIDFYSLLGDEYRWKNDHQDYCEWTGNEAQPEIEDSIYINRALILI